MCCDISALKMPPRQKHTHCMGTLNLDVQKMRPILLRLKILPARNVLKQHNCQGIRRLPPPISQTPPTKPHTSRTNSRVTLILRLGLRVKVHFGIMNPRIYLYWAWQGFVHSPYHPPEPLWYSIQDFPKTYIVSIENS